MAVNTSMPAGKDFTEKTDDMLKVNQKIELEPRSVLILVGV